MTWYCAAAVLDLCLLWKHWVVFVSHQRCLTQYVSMKVEPVCRLQMLNEWPSPMSAIGWKKIKEVTNACNKSNVLIIISFKKYDFSAIFNLEEGSSIGILWIKARQKGGKLFFFSPFQNFKGFRTSSNSAKLFLCKNLVFTTRKQKCMVPFSPLREPKNSIAVNTLVKYEFQKSK